MVRSMSLVTRARAAGEIAIDAEWPDNPVLVRLRRGGAVESQHRGAWCLVDGAGRVLEGQGGFERPVFARSSVKSLQALPLVESGAAERFGFEPADLALAIASHDGEPLHARRVAARLAALGLGPEALRCGPQAPGNEQARAALRARGEAPSALHNNCSGKHAGFLALALYLGDPPERYLDPDSRTQREVRAALLEVTGLAPEALGTAIDGCSAPTFRLPLQALATGFARITSPERLPERHRAAARRLLDAAAAFPELVGGTRGRLCTEILRASGGRLFPKLGGEAVYAVGLAGGDRALAVKIDDGALRALHPLVVHLLEALGFAEADELAALEPFRERVLRNWAGLEVGRTEVLARAP
jgi:L-asparaginase II